MQLHTVQASLQQQYRQTINSVDNIRRIERISHDQIDMGILKVHSELRECFYFIIENCRNFSFSNIISLQTFLSPMAFQ